jgi:DNA-binding NtrC family response regulator
MNILLVEDSPEVSLITVEYLLELGHQAVAVEDAELALQRVADERFDTVMTDVSLPGMSGIELARELVRRHPGLPVVIASGYGSINLSAMLSEKKPNILSLQKPYDMTTLEKTLAQAAAIIAAG